MNKPKTNRFLIKIIGLGAVVVLLASSFTKLDYAQPGKVPRLEHIAIVIEENHSFEDVIGNRGMPYLNALAKRYGLATEYYANSRPSIPDYFWLTAGQPLTFDSNEPKNFDVDNIFRRLIEKRMTWKVYAQSIPSIGFIDYTNGPYLKRHNPAAYFTDTRADSQRQNIVSSQQLQKDITSDQLPNYMLIIPDAENDAHGGSLAQADAWLKAHVEPLVEKWRDDEKSLIVVTFDEGRHQDDRHDGGRIVTLLIGKSIIPSFRSDSFYQHQHLLSTVCEAFSFETCPGLANEVPTMAEFFQ